MIVTVRNPNGFIMCCDFCATSEKETAMLIASPNGTHICEKCVALCQEVILSQEGEK